MTDTLLIRYGLIPEVARFAADCGDVVWDRGQQVVVQSHRGCELGTILEALRSGVSTRVNGNGVSATNGTNGSPPTSDDPPAEIGSPMTVLRAATEDDQRVFDELQSECRGEFDQWAGRIAEWNLDLELIDSEWLLDRGKLVLYVLNERGSDCTKLALYAAAGGLGTVEVQPVGVDGLVQMPIAGSGGGGSCGTESSTTASNHKQNCRPRINANLINPKNSGQPRSNPPTPNQKRSQTEIR